MEVILIDDRADRRHLGDLVAERLGIIALELMAAVAALWRLAVDHI
jgi:hypothetical protein